MKALLAALEHIDETANLIQSHGWGLAAIAIIVTLMLTLFAINMVDARKREQRYVEESRGRENDMKSRITTMEDRQYREMASMSLGYHKALVEQTAVCQELGGIMRETTRELAACRRGREILAAKCPVDGNPEK